MWLSFFLFFINEYPVSNLCDILLLLLMSPKNHKEKLGICWKTPPNKVKVIFVWFCHLILFSILKFVSKMIGSSFF